MRRCDHGYKTVWDGGGAAAARTGIPEVVEFESEEDALWPSNDVLLVAALENDEADDDNKGPLPIGGDCPDDPSPFLCLFLDEKMAISARAVPLKPPSDASVKRVEVCESPW